MKLKKKIKFIKKIKNMKTLTPIHKFKRKILVTGGAGFIASSLAEKLAEDKENLVVVLDNLSTGNIDKLSHDSDNLRFIKADVNKYVEIMEVMLSYQFHYVFIMQLWLEC